VSAVPYPVPGNESVRVAKALDYGIMDTLPEQAYDALTALASAICGTPIALITLLDGKRQWFKSRVGLEATETPREDAFCAHAIIEPDAVMVVPDAALDARFMNNPLVLGDPNIRFYAGAPLVTPEGYALGTLCVIDREPRELSESQLESLRLLSKVVVNYLEMRRTIAQFEDAVLERDNYLEHLESYQRDLEASASRLEAASMLDQLTGVGNRRALESRLEEEYARAARYGATYSVLMVDIDHFKDVNDSAGHAAGDAVIVTTAALLRSALRPADFLARFGGDEFAAVLPHTDSQSAMVIAERMRRTIHGASWDHPVTISVGAATWRAGKDGASEVLARADEALYRSKAAGRNCVTGPASVSI